jgi:hypothetical protein
VICRPAREEQGCRAVRGCGDGTAAEDGEKDGNLISGAGIHLGKRVNSLSEYQGTEVSVNRISTTRLNTNLEVEL